MKRKFIIHADQLVTPLGRKALHGKDMNKLYIIHDAAVCVEDEIIIAVGTTESILKAYIPSSEDEIIDASGQCILPGFVDSHTHFVFGGYRSQEFIDRLKGKAYLDILKAGGGIQNTVRSTRGCSEEQLYKDGFNKLQEMLSMGITTVEGKSGYGLDKETEVKQLRVYSKLKENHPMDIAITYMGAHAVPPEYNEDQYIDKMIKEIMPYIKENEMAEFCDVFCEEGVFSVEQSERLLTAARDMGFKLKIHANEMTSLGGAALAARIKAVSADHLLMITEQEVEALGKSGTIATLLPCTAFCLAHPYAPGRKMIDRGCAVALASDYNPGSCFTNSIPLIFALSVIHMKLTIEEAITALTLNGAAALGRSESIGSIEPGKQADIIFLKEPDYGFLVYNTGTNQVKHLMKKGRLIY